MQSKASRSNSVSWVYLLIKATEALGAGVVAYFYAGTGDYWNGDGDQARPPYRFKRGTRKPIEFAVACPKTSQK